MTSSFHIQGLRTPVLFWISTGPNDTPALACKTAEYTLAFEAAALDLPPQTKHSSPPLQLNVMLFKTSEQSSCNRVLVLQKTRRPLSIRDWRKTARAHGLLATDTTLKSSTTTVASLKAGEKTHFRRSVHFPRDSSSAAVFSWMEAVARDVFEPLLPGHCTRPRAVPRYIIADSEECTFTQVIVVLAMEYFRARAVSGAFCFSWTLHEALSVYHASAS